MDQWLVDIAERINKAKDTMNKTDMVNHPPHYTFGEIECIDAIEAMMSPESFIDFLRGSLMQYLWRMGRKHDAYEDLGKAEFYINKLKQKLKEAHDRKDSKNPVQGKVDTKTVAYGDFPG